MLSRNVLIIATLSCAPSAIAQTTAAQAADDIRALFVIGGNNVPPLRDNAAEVFDAIGRGEVDAQALLKNIVPSLVIPPAARYDATCSSKWTMMTRKLTAIYTFGFAFSPEQEKQRRNARRMADRHKDFEAVDEKDPAIKVQARFEADLKKNGFVFNQTAFNRTLLWGRQFFKPRASPAEPLTFAELQPMYDPASEQGFADRAREVGRNLPEGGCDNMPTGPYFIVVIGPEH